MSNCKADNRQILLLKIVNVIENFGRNPFVFCYCNSHFCKCETCRLFDDYSNFCYDKRVIRCLKFVVKSAVDISKREQTIVDNLKDNNLIIELAYTNTNSSCLAGLCIHDLMKVIDSRQLFLEASYYC